MRPLLYRIAYRLVGDRHEAEDMVQEAFRSAWKSRESYEAGAGRPGLAGGDPAAAGRRPLPAACPASHLARPTDRTRSACTDADPLANQYTDEMQHALAQLPEDLRETLLLVVVGELTHQEVADLLEIPLGTVLSRVSRARRRLREVLMAAKT